MTRPGTHTTPSSGTTATARSPRGPRQPGSTSPAGTRAAAVADVNGDGRLDLAVAGYTDVNRPVPESTSGFPANRGGVRDLLYLNVGGRGGHPRFREVGRAAGLEPHGLDHGLGATFTDVNGDGRPDLFVANDLDPNRLYLNLPAKNGLGFRLVENGRELALDDSNAGMGVAAGDFSGDGREDLFVTNSRGQLHAVYRSRAGKPFADARPDFVGSLGRTFTGWGVTWADLDNDGTPELAMANGAIPVTSLAKDAEPVRVLSTDGGHVRPLDVGSVAPRNGRGLAAADFDNDGDLDLAVGSIGGAVQLLRNDGGSQAGHWLEVSLRRFVAGHGRHGRPPRGPPARPGRARGLELPLVRGPAAPLRTRQGHAGRRARRPLPRWHGHAAARCRSRPHRHAGLTPSHRIYDPAGTPPSSARRLSRPEGGLAAREARPVVRCLRPEGGGSGEPWVPHARFPHAHFPQPGSRPAAPRVSSTTSIRRFDERTCSRASVRAARALPAEIASRIARCWRSFFA